MASSDIKILGRLVSGTSDGVLTVASGVYDETEEKFQSLINAEQKTKNSTLETKIQALEGSVGDGIPTVLGTSGLDAITEESVDGDQINVYKFKDFDETVNPPHLKRHGFVFVQKNELTFKKFFIGYKQDDANDFANIVFCCEEYLGSGEWGNGAVNVPERIVQGIGESTTAVMSQKAVTDALAEAGKGNMAEFHVDFNAGEDTYKDYLKISLADLRTSLSAQLEENGYLDDADASKKGCAFILYMHRKTNSESSGDAILNDMPQLIYGVFNKNSHGISKYVYLYGCFKVEGQSEQLDGSELLSVPELYFKGEDEDIVSVVEINLDEGVYSVWGKSSKGVSSIDGGGA